MIDLRARFRAVDDVPTPSLRSAIDRRVNQGADRTPAVRTSVSKPLGLLVACLAAATIVAVTINILTRPDPVALPTKPEVGLVPGVDASADAGWLTDEGSVGHCVETFSVDHLSERGWAFEGVVTDVQVGDPMATEPEPTLVTFDVRRWFFGGSGSSFTAKTYSAPGSITSVGSGGGSAVGAHLLASGDDEFVWACGFTQEYTVSGASSFERAQLRR